MNKHETTKNTVLETLKSKTNIGAVINVLQNGNISVLQNYKRQIIEIDVAEGIVMDHGVMVALLDEIEKAGFLTKNIITGSMQGMNNSTTNTKRISYRTTYSLYTKTNNGEYIFFAREFGNDKTLKLYNTLKKKIKDFYNIDTIMLEEDTMPGNIHNYMYNKIKNCSVMIADLTAVKNNDAWNANVVYEMGMAVGFGKKVIQILSLNTNKTSKNNIKDLPFDFGSHSTFSYDENKIEESSIKVLRLLETYLTQE